MDKLDSPQEFMKYTVTRLCDLTYFALAEFQKKHKGIHDTFFIMNVLSNYVGNMLMQGTEGGRNLDDFKKFMIAFNEEMDHYVEKVSSIIKQEKLKEAH